MDFTETSARKINGIVSELIASGHSDVPKVELLKMAVSIYNSDEIADQIMQVEEAVSGLETMLRKIYLK